MLSKKKKTHILLILQIVLVTLVIEHIRQESLNLNISYYPITAEDKLALGCKLSLIDLDQFTLSKIPTISGIRAEKIIKKIESLDQNYFKNKNYNNLDFFKSIHGIGDKTAKIIDRYTDLNEYSKTMSNKCYVAQ